jgi:hypothetical protein
MKALLLVTSSVTFGSSDRVSFGGNGKGTGSIQDQPRMATILALIRPLGAARNRAESKELHWSFGFAQVARVTPNYCLGDSHHQITPQPVEDLGPQRKPRSY